MCRQLTAAIAFSLAFGLNAAVGQAADSGGHKAPGEDRVMKEDCTSMGAARRAKCLKDANGKDKTKDKYSVWRCEDTTSRKERECIVRELERQHADSSQPGQVGNNPLVAPVPQLR